MASFKICNKRTMKLKYAKLLAWCIYHTGPSFNTGTENTIQVLKFKRIGFEKKWRILMGANKFVNIVYLLSRSVSLYPNKNYVTDR